MGKRRLRKVKQLLKDLYFLKEKEHESHLRTWARYRRMEIKLLKEKRELELNAKR